MRTNHRGAVVWFTGLSGAGKSTVAHALEGELAARGQQAIVLDGDVLRQGLNADLGFSTADRAENIRRAAEVARLFADAGFIVLAAFISPHQADREWARHIVQRGASGITYIDVYLSTPLGTCELRDPKGLYARARAGEITDFTGVSAPFEAPDHADVVIDTSVVPLNESVARLLDDLAPRLSAPSRRLVA